MKNAARMPRIKGTLGNARAPHLVRFGAGFLRIGSESKGHRSRHLPIDSELKEVLDAQTPVESYGGFVTFVFVNPRTRKDYRVTSLSLTFAASARRANVKGVSFHTLRHTASQGWSRPGSPTGSS